MNVFISIGINIVYCGTPILISCDFAFVPSSVILKAFDMGFPNRNDFKAFIISMAFTSNP